MTGARVLRADSWPADAALAVALVVALEVQCWLSQGVSHHDRMVTAVASVLFAAPVAARRMLPGPALVFSCAVLVVQVPLGGQLVAGALPGLLLPVAVLLVLAYGAGAFMDARPSAIALGLALALVCSTPFLPGAGSVPPGIGDVLSSLFYSSLIVFPGWFVGRLVHRQARRGQAFRRLATEAAEEQDRRRTLALAEERDRIGRELQDIVTHAVSSMVVQAGGARLLLRTDPERARVGILNVEHTGREALADLRRMLGMLRKDDDPRSLSPQPGLDRVPELIASSGQAGLRCDLQFVGERVDLTPGVDLVAYRAIEEVLAAARRHGAATALVTVDGRTGGLELTIRADHLTGDVDHDLDAIVDRVHLYDGSLRVEAGGRASEGALTVRVHLPFGGGVLA
jgi:signal transduction histidine kinase